MGLDIGPEDHVGAAVLEADAQLAVDDIDGEVVAAAGIAVGVLGQDAGPAGGFVGIEAERDDPGFERQVLGRRQFDHVDGRADLKRAGAGEHDLLPGDLGRDPHFGFGHGGFRFGVHYGSGPGVGLRFGRRRFGRGFLDLERGGRGDGHIRDGAVEGALEAALSGVAGPAERPDLQVFHVGGERHVEVGGADQLAVQPGRDLAIAELDLQVVGGMGLDIGREDHLGAAVLEADAQLAVGDIDGEVVAAAGKAVGILGQDAGPAGGFVGVEAERDDPGVDLHRLVMGDLDHVARRADLERTGAAVDDLAGHDLCRAALRFGRCGLGGCGFGGGRFGRCGFGGCGFGGGRFGGRFGSRSVVGGATRAGPRLAARIRARTGGRPFEPVAAVQQVVEEIDRAHARGFELRARDGQEGGPVHAAALEERAEVGAAAVYIVVADGGGAGLVVKDLHDVAGHRGARVVIAGSVRQADDRAAAVQRHQRVVLDDDIVLAAIDGDGVARVDRDQVLFDQQVVIAALVRVGDEDALRRHRLVAGRAVVIHHVLANGDVMGRVAVGAEHLQEVGVIVAAGAGIPVVAVILRHGVEEVVVLDLAVIAVAGHAHQVFLGAVDIVVGDREVLHVVDQQGVEVALDVVAVHDQPVHVLHVDDAVDRGILEPDAFGGIGAERIDRDALEGQVRAVVHDHIAEHGAVLVLGGDGHRGAIGLRDIECSVVCVLQNDGVATVCRLECALQLGLAANRNHRHRSGAPCCVIVKVIPL